MYRLTYSSADLFKGWPVYRLIELFILYYLVFQSLDYERWLLKVILGTCRTKLNIHAIIAIRISHRFTRRVPLVKQELSTFPEHMCSPSVISGVRVIRSLALYVCFVDRCLSFCAYSFGHCVVCSSSKYGFWLPPFGIFKLSRAKTELQYHRMLTNESIDSFCFHPLFFCMKQILVKCINIILPLI